MATLNGMFGEIHHKAANLCKFVDEKGSAKLRYRLAYNRKCNLRNPMTFSEKLLWLEFHTYRNNKTILDLCDKYLVREYIQACGCGDTLNELYGRYDTADDIPWDKLPDRYVLKLTLGCGKNAYCRDKRTFDADAAKNQIAGWKKGMFMYNVLTARIGGIRSKELPTSIICERYLGDETGVAPTDYKVYCFNGKPVAVLVIGDRYGNTGGCFMDIGWNKISDRYDGVFYINQDFKAEKPASYERMLEVAARLSAPFPFVRVDFYDYQGSCVFGEMTFFPAGGIHVDECNVGGKEMGELLDISAEMNRYRAKVADERK